MAHNINYIDLILNPKTTTTEQQLLDVGHTAEEIQIVLEARAKLANAEIYQSALNEKQLELQEFQAKKMKESLVDTFQVIADLKISLKKVLKESSDVQIIARIMFGMTFLLGFILIGFAIYFAVKGQEFLATTFGVFGMIDIVGLLIANPPLKLQDSRSNYAQLTVGVLAWFNDFIEKSTINAKVSSMIELVFQEPIPIDEQLKLSEGLINRFLEISNSQIAITDKILRTIDEVAEPTSKNTKQSIKK